MLALVNDPLFIQNIGDRHVRSFADAQQYIEKRILESYDRLGFGMYMVELKGQGTPIGICGLVKRETLPDVDIGFAFLPAFWSNGYTIESAVAVINYAKDVLELKRVLGITSPDNAPSIRVLEKLGLRFERKVMSSEEASESSLYAVEFA